MFFDPLIVAAHELQNQLASGRLTSRQIVIEYLQHIKRYDDYLGAIQQLAPFALDEADRLDQLRSRGELLGPLHGIPVVLKDNIATSPALGMDTTAGTLALKGSKPKASAPFVCRLRDAGAILLGKASLSELGYWKGTEIPCGWSAAGGQAQNPYIKGGYNPSDHPIGHSTPAGSSSGPAVAVSAGLAPIAVGAETVGSLVTPSTRTSLYCLKPTIGIISSEGMVPLSHEFDSAGPIAKCVRDLADLLTVLVDPSQTVVPAAGYASFMTDGKKKELNIGTLKPEDWQYDPSMFKEGNEGYDQIFRETKAAYEKIGTFAKTVQENVPLRSADDYTLDGVDATLSIMCVDLEKDIGSYLESLEESKVHSLEELVKWNDEHADEALTPQYPTQDLLIKSLEAKATTEMRDRLLEHVKRVGADLSRVFDEYGLDVIVGPGDSWLCRHAAAQGAPVASLPMSYLKFNGRPIGLSAAARPHSEAKLIEFMSAWESVANPREPPVAFKEHAKL